MKKVTLEDLLERKFQAENNRNSYMDIEVPELDMILTFQKVNPKKILELINGMQGNDLSLSDNYDKCIELIYECCPMLHDSKLLKDVAEPFEVVPLVFSDNIEAIMNTAAKIVTTFYGGNFGEELKKEIKN